MEITGPAHDPAVKFNYDYVDDFAEPETHSNSAGMASYSICIFEQKPVIIIYYCCIIMHTTCISPMKTFSIVLAIVQHGNDHKDS